MKRKMYLVLLTGLAVALLASCGGSKKNPFLLLPLATAAQSVGGNEGVPVSANNDPAPTVTPQTTNGPGSPATSPDGKTMDQIIAEQPSTQDGTSTSPNVFVENGAIVGNLDGGTLTTGDGQVIQVVKDGKLLGNLIVIITTQNGVQVPGHIIIVGDDFVFIPDTAMDPNQVYTVVITIGNGSPISINIFLAVDNTCNAQSLFAQVPVLSSGNNTMLINSKMVTDNNGAKKSLIGWDFAGGNFQFKLSNKTAGRKYVMTAYGVYAIPGHNCEVYFQRWSGTNLPVDNFNITSYGTISVDATDASIPNPAGGYYSFAKTYVQMKVLDSNGVDVTETDNASMSLNWYASTAAMMKTPDRLSGMKYSAPEMVRSQDSALAAFMRGSGRKSMVVLGAILVFAIGALGVIMVVRRTRQHT